MLTRSSASISNSSSWSVLAAAARLRAERAAVTHRGEAELQLPCLADYDAAFGLDDGAVA